MKNISIWKSGIKRVKYPKLKSDLDVDVLIIGGGITGVSSLYHLGNSKLSVALVEQNKVGFSVTGNSTGKLTYLQNDLIDNIRKISGDKNAFSYLSFEIENMNKMVKLIRDKKIDCDLTMTDSYLYTDKDEDVDKIKSLEKFLNNSSINTNLVDDIDLVESKYMISTNKTYLINPIKFLYGLLNDEKYSIYENTRVTSIDKKDDIYTVKANEYEIRCKWIILANHYPYFLKPFFFPLKANLEKSYLSASKCKHEDLSLISYTNPFISIRTYQDYLIYLSNSHSLNKDVDDEKNYIELIKKINDLKLKPSYLWSNTDIMTLDSMPYIGRLKDNILISTGYNTWGLINGFASGSILSDIINNKKNKYIELFNPRRTNNMNVSSYFNNIVKNIDGYIKGMKSHAKENTIDGKKVLSATVKDKEYTVYKKCPHLGCGLIYNSVEKIWDCPCHGSRFSIDGKCISGPANKDIGLIIDKKM